MGRIFERNHKGGLSLLVTMMMIMAVAVFLIGTPAMAGEQGDRIWTASAPGFDSSGGAGNFGSDGSGASTFAVSFPRDANAQAVVYYIDATGAAAGEDLEYWGYLAGNTVYQETTAAFCGGTTSYVHVNNGMVGASGASYFVIDDGAGNSGWGEYLNKRGTGDIIEVSAGASNFAQGPTWGLDDLSGVTFPAGVRVYPVFRLGRTVIGNGDTSKDNSQGLVAATKGSPLLVVLQSRVGIATASVGSGVTLHAVTVRYE